MKAVAEIADEYARRLSEMKGMVVARKKAGPYFTPECLVEQLVDDALQPLIDEACAASTPAARINRLMEITVCDPACGAGAFLIAAARRIARAVAAQASAWLAPAARGPLGAPAPTAELAQHALRRVTATLIHGVDLSASGVELAKAALWLQAFNPDHPNCYLDDKIRCGNSLLGTTPALMAAGIPDAAFTALRGDDSKAVTQFRKQNARERDGQQGDLF